MIDGSRYLKDPHMALKSSDIHPFELVREAFSIAKASWKHVMFSAGVFALLAALIAIFTGGASKPLDQVGQMAVMFTMFLATITAALVTSSRALGIEVPTLASALVNDRQFWRYVWGGVVCLFLMGLVVFAIFIAGVAMVPNLPLSGVRNVSEIDLRPLYGAAVVGAVLSALLSVRLSLVLPAVIAGEKVSVAASWKRTRGITVKLALAAVVALGGFYVVGLAVKYVGAYGIDGSPMVEVLSAAIRIARSSVEGALAGIVMGKILDDEAVSQPT